MKYLNRQISNTLTPVIITILVAFHGVSCKKDQQPGQATVTQPTANTPTAFFAAAGINPDWKISLHIYPDSTFYTTLTLPGNQEPFSGRVIPFTMFPAGTDRLNDIYSGTVRLHSESRELLIRIQPDLCGGKPFSNLANAGCEVIAGGDTLSGCGRWLNREGL
jgi:hypothetical protein